MYSSEDTPLEEEKGMILEDGSEAKVLEGPPPDLPPRTVNGKQDELEEDDDAAEHS